MDLPGVNFQPGITNGVTRPRSRMQSGAQEAIKILSMRLPKVVGAQSIAPAALLNSQGSGGNPRVDSVVNTVMRRFFPTGDPGSGAPPAAAPMIPPTGGNGSSDPPMLGPRPGESHTMPVSPPVRFDGNTRPPDNTPLSSMMPTGSTSPRSTTPNITFNNPTPPGTRMPDEWTTPPPPPPPGFDDAFPRFDGPLAGADPVAPPVPTQDPWNDLMEYLRRSSYEPAPPQETYAI